MRTYSSICSILAATLLGGALRPPTVEAAEPGTCNYFFGLCTSCELPLTCSTSERLDPTQAFGTQQARSTVVPPNSGRAAQQQASTRPSNVRQRVRPKASEFEKFKVFLREQGYDYKSASSGEQQALFERFVRWKGRGNRNDN